MDRSAPPTTTADAGVSKGRRVIAGSAAVALLLVGVATVLLIDRDDDTSTVDAGGADPPASGWTQLPNPPLSPRAGASAAWTGQEIVVVGGWEFLCPPGASCVGPTEAPFTDGAAYSPSTGTWRRIADAPAAFEGAHPAVVDGAVFFLIDCAVDFRGIDGEAAADRCPQSQEPTAFLRYDPVPDSWTQLPGPPGDRRYAIERVGDSIIAFAGSEERGEEQEWRFDLSSETWAELPDDPLPRMYDRSIVPADDGRSALLFGANAETGPSSEPSEEVNLAARLDLESMTWTELPPSPSRGYRAWGVDDSVVLEPHFGGAGGLFDPEAGTWSSLTSALPQSFDSNRVAGTFGRNDATYADASGWVFDVDERRWLEVPPIDDRDVFPPSSVTAAGRDLFVFGGERWTSSDGELLGDAWVWVAPSSDGDAGSIEVGSPSDPTVAPRNSARGRARLR